MQRQRRRNSDVKISWAPPQMNIQVIFITSHDTDMVARQCLIHTPRLS